MHQVSLDFVGAVERTIGMRNRARTAGAPSTATRTPAPTPVPEATAPTKTKYDELVEVLVDGLFEIMMTESPRDPDRTKARRARERR
jgi:hypothetical protein